MSDDTKKKRGLHTSIPPLPDDDPIFRLGPIVAGRPLFTDTAKEEGGMGGCTVRGYARPDHKVFTMGPMVNGKPLFPANEEHGCRDIGRLPHNHPIYSAGVFIIGRPSPAKKKEEREDD